MVLLLGSFAGEGVSPSVIVCLEPDNLLSNMYALPCRGGLISAFCIATDCRKVKRDVELQPPWFLRPELRRGAAALQQLPPSALTDLSSWQSRSRATLLHEPAPLPNLQPSPSCHSVIAHTKPFHALSSTRRLSCSCTPTEPRSHLQASISLASWCRGQLAFRGRSRWSTMQCCSPFFHLFAPYQAQHMDSN